MYIGIWVFPKIRVPQNGWVYNGKPYWNGKHPFANPGCWLVTIRITTIFWGDSGGDQKNAFIPSHPKMYLPSKRTDFSPLKIASPPKIKGSSNQIASIVQSGAVFFKKIQICSRNTFFGKQSAHRWYLSAGQKYWWVKLQFFFFCGVDLFSDQIRGKNPG